MKDAVTHAWLRRVSDYHSGGVSADERAAVEAHLADCAECRQALATYQRFYTLARSPLRLGDGGKGALAGYRPVIQEEIMINIEPDRQTGSTLTRRGRPRAALTTLGAIAAVVLIAVLAAALFAQFRGPSRPPASHPHPTATAALDAQTQAYVSVLRTYYPPLAQAGAQEYTQCVSQPAFLRASQLLAIMPACRPVEVAVLSAAQTLLVHLQATPAPARWQAASGQLKQAVQGHITGATELIKAIDAHDVQSFISAADGVILPDSLYCSALKRINFDLGNQGFSGASLQDLQPFAVELCSGDVAPEGAGG